MVEAATDLSVFFGVLETGHRLLHLEQILGLHSCKLALNLLRGEVFRKHE